MQMHVWCPGWAGECTREAQGAARPALRRPPKRFPSASLGTHRAASLAYRLVPLLPSPRLVPAMGAPPQPPPPPGLPLGCGNARMLPLPAAPAHKCGRRAKGACEVGERRGQSASRARAGRDAPPEGDGRRAHPPGRARRSSGRVSPSSRR